MMTQDCSQADDFRMMLEKIYELASGNGDSLQKARKKSLEHFLAIGLPTKRTEVYQYVRLRQLFSKKYSVPSSINLSESDISAYVYPECQGAYFTFVNGEYREDLSSSEKIPENVVVMDLAEATRTYGAFLSNNREKAIQEEVDAFAALNGAIHAKGLFLYIPPNTIVEQPVQFIHIVNTPDDLSMITPRIQVFAGKSSEITLYSSLELLSDGECLINRLIDFSLEENSKVLYTEDVTNQREGNWHFDAVRADLKRNSRFQSININEGSYTYRNDYHVILSQEGSSAELDGVWMLYDKRESHINVLMDHRAPNCNSRQLFKGVLRDVSKSSFEGKIFVRQAAQKTDAFQLNNNLLLSERAHADSKPNLEIFADDVKASHGSTVGRPDREQFFYLLSRGLSPMIATNLLVFAYCQEVINRIRLPSLAKKLTDKAQNYIR